MTDRDALDDVARSLLAERFTTHDRTAEPTPDADAEQHRRDLMEEEQHRREVAESARHLAAAGRDGTHIVRGGTVGPDERKEP